MCILASLCSPVVLLILTCLFGIALVLRSRSKRCDNEQRVAALREVMAFFRGHPHIGCKALSFPSKTLELLKHVDVSALHALLDVTPKEVASALLPSLLGELTQQQLVSHLAPLVSARPLRDSVAATMMVLCSSSVVVLVRDVPPRNLATILCAPPAALASFMKGIWPDRMASNLIPLLREQALIQHTILPLLSQTAYPERLGDLVNFAQPQVLLQMMKRTPVTRLLAIVDCLEDEDARPGGSIVELLAKLAEEPLLVEETVLPLLHYFDPKLVVMLLKSIPLDQSLATIRTLNLVPDCAWLRRHEPKFTLAVACAECILPTHPLAVPLGAFSHTLGTGFGSTLSADLLALAQLGAGFAAGQQIKGEAKPLSLAEPPASACLAVHFARR